MRAAMPGEIYTTVLDAQLNGTVAPAEGFDAGAKKTGRAALAYFVFDRGTLTLMASASLTTRNA